MARGDRFAAQAAARYSFLMWGLAANIYSLASSDSYNIRSATVLGLSLFLILTYIRRYNLQQADKLIAGDQASYDLFWAKLTKEEAANGGHLKATLEEQHIKEWTQYMENVAGVKEWNERAQQRGGWVRAYCIEGVSLMKQARDAIKEDVTSTVKHYTGTAAQVQPPKDLRDTIQNEELSLSETIAELKENEEGGNTPSAEGSKGSTTISIVPIAEPNAVVPVMQPIKALHESPSRLKKSAIVMSVVKQIHNASDAKGLPWNKPRQVMSDVAVLFAQAMEMNDHFQRKVKGWAVSCEGTHFKYVPVKRRKRAIEKLWRSYRGDGARLIDLVRSTIEVETTADLGKCLKEILNDPGVAVLQIKNRFSERYNSKESAGYRNLSLSLLVVDQFTMFRGVDAHVCELQLGLEAFEYLKKRLDGHKRYVKFRDRRAE
jgi:hypothetical protein